MEYFEQVAQFLWDRRQVIGLLAAIVTLFGGAYGAWQRFGRNESARNAYEDNHIVRNWLPMWKISRDGLDSYLRRLDWWPFRRVIALAQAAKIARDKMIDTETGKEIEQICRVMEMKPLEWYATWLAEQGQTPLFGTMRASSTFQLVAPIEAKRCTFVEDAFAMRRFSEPENLYENIHIKKADTKRILSDMKSSQSQWRAAYSTV